MSYINGATVYIDGINRTHNTVMPLKLGQFLDERLDECYLSLRRIKKENFQPLTPVEIILSNKFFIHTNERNNAKETLADEEQRTLRFIVANASARENPFGSGFYDHDLYLIEVTKSSECITCDAQTITNDLGKNYTANAKPVTPVEE